jgi:hypothetical protein
MKGDYPCPAKSRDDTHIITSPTTHNIDNYSILDLITCVKQYSVLTARILISRRHNSLRAIKRYTRCYNVFKSKTKS